MGCGSPAWSVVCYGPTIEAMVHGGGVKLFPDLGDGVVEVDVVMVVMVVRSGDGGSR
uniref:Uncharacterized protein n=1 Tax=Fagus sylvatica TaxID=28930 RepID=A0A2N9J306_FAGSY